MADGLLAVLMAGGLSLFLLVPIVFAVHEPSIVAASLAWQCVFVL